AYVGNNPLKYVDPSGHDRKALMDRMNASYIAMSNDAIEHVDDFLQAKEEKRQREQMRKLFWMTTLMPAVNVNMVGSNFYFDPKRTEAYEHIREDYFLSVYDENKTLMDAVGFVGSVGLAVLGTAIICYTGGALLGASAAAVVAETGEVAISVGAVVKEGVILLVEASALSGSLLMAVESGKELLEDAKSEGGTESNTLTDAQKSRLNALDNTINDHLTEGDFSGTLRDLQGNPVPDGKGGYFDHIGEMQDSYRSLQKIKNALEGSLRNPNLSDVDRALLKEGVDTANSYISRIEGLFTPYGGIK
ncbi:MAG: hypothetical protein ACI4FZ_06610, partial [Lachnospiraceae bacterium]